MGLAPNVNYRKYLKWRKIIQLCWNHRRTSTMIIQCWHHHVSCFWDWSKATNLMIPDHWMISQLLNPLKFWSDCAARAFAARSWCTLCVDGEHMAVSRLVSTCPPINYQPIHARLLSFLNVTLPALIKGLPIRKSQLLFLQPCQLMSSPP